MPSGWLAAPESPVVELRCSESGCWSRLAVDPASVFKVTGQADDLGRLEHVADHHTYHPPGE